MEEVWRGVGMGHWTTEQAEALVQQFVPLDDDGARYGLRRLKPPEEIRAQVNELPVDEDFLLPTRIGGHLLNMRITPEADPLFRATKTHEENQARMPRP